MKMGQKGRLMMLKHILLSRKISLMVGCNKKIFNYYEFENHLIYYIII